MSDVDPNPGELGPGTANPSVELTTNGVGPWRGELPTEPWYDAELLSSGDSRNVIDR